MYLFEQYGIDIGYVVIGLAGVVLLLLIMIIVMMVRNHLLRKKYKQFMEGENGRSLEKAFSDKFKNYKTIDYSIPENWISKV